MLDGNCVRPFAWSSHNLLFLSDPNSPAVHAKHLPPAPEASQEPDVISQAQSYPLRFTLPPPVAEMAHAYGPATIVSISPQDKYLYAFFPPAQSNVSTGGLGCVWGVEESLDTWTIKDFWHYSADAGVVTMRWLGEEREWHAQAGPTLRAARYPHLGPKTHYNHPAFLAVTGDHNLRLYFQAYPSVDTSQLNGLQRFFNALSVSLLSPTAAVQGHQEHISVQDATLGGKRVCIKAAIGLGYNDWSILIATRSSLIPSQDADNSISMAAVMNELMPEDNAGELTAMTWMRGGMWGEEDLIELCEVEIDLLSDEPCLVATPLRSIPTPKDNESYLTHLLITSYALESSNSALVVEPAEIRCSFQVVASFLINTELSRPRSKVLSWRVSKSGVLPGSRTSSPSRNKNVQTPDWSCLQSAHLVYESAVVSAAQIWDAAGQILLCKINLTPGSYGTQNKWVEIGELGIVSSITLENNLSFEPEPVLRHQSKASKDFPMFISASPHRTLICTTSSTQRIPTVSIHIAPRCKGTTNPSGSIRMISSAIALQVRRSSGSDLSDVTRAMWEIVSKTNAAEASAAIQAIFNEVFILLDSALEYDVNQPWLMSLIGVLLTVYRWSPFKDMRPRWKTASEICQLYAAVRALDDSRSVNEGTQYDFTPQGIWELIQQIRWVIERCETLLRTLVEWEGRQFSEETPSELIMAIHPLPLELFNRAVAHLNRLKAATDNIKKTENNQIAIFSLSALVDDAGINFVTFAAALQTAKELVRNPGKRQVWA
ncbi:Histone transcription regulator 3 homolog [Aspergillus oryzae RIB40] [Rhizoctonia solani]|uniref:Histone transcription regulator 3 homolog [Aspergillus oryzae RIB40] n=1 Tax=Rhizoctonia solani TaxID=456999 RepID=A0A0K6FVS2_9AGAM|nr:Histone transcription regulator 3 homolog [Aspergillus oryzae RIB40] [Rhizoctonia solani]